MSLRVRAQRLLYHEPAWFVGGCGTFLAVTQDLLRNQHVSVRDVLVGLTAVVIRQLVYPPAHVVVKRLDSKTTQQGPGA